MKYNYVKSILFSIFIFVTIIVIILIVIDYYNDSIFMVTFIATLIATIIGAIFGIPIALWVNTNLQNVEIKQRRSSLLKTIKGELVRNLDVAKHSLEIFERDGHTVSPTLMKNEFWNAITYGGEIRWISDDIELIGMIAAIYHNIYKATLLELRYYDILVSNPQKISEPIRELKYREKCHPVDQVFSDLQGSYYVCIDLLEKALENPNFKKITLEVDPIRSETVG
jgi:hypothetical protein